MSFARLCVEGGDRSLLPTNRRWSSELLASALCDPEVFMFSAPGHIGSSAMAFDLPWDLIEGMGGHIVPRLENATGKLFLDIDLCMAS